MLGMVAEPIIYLVVWTTIADQSGGSVQGISAGEFAAYYIVWTLVRNMNIVFGAPCWEWRIREGELAGQLMRPIHPLHRTSRTSPAGRSSSSSLWLPIGFALTLLFDPAFDLTPEEIAIFCRGHLGRVPHPHDVPCRARDALLLDDARGGDLRPLHGHSSSCFRAGSFLYRSCLTGCRRSPWFFPFQWTFYFPIDALIGDLTTAGAARRARQQAVLDPRRLRSLHARLAAGDQALLGGGQLMVRIRVDVFLKVGVLNELQYRVNFVVQLLPVALRSVDRASSCSGSSTRTRTELNGWTEAELLVVLGIQMLHGRRHPRLHPAEHGQRCSDDPREGTFDYALTKPEDAQVLVSVREFRIWQVVDVVTRACGARPSASAVSSRMSAADASAVPVALVLGTAMIYCFWLVLTTGAFWLVRMEQLVRALRRRLPHRPLPCRHLPALASLRHDVPRADRVRRHGAGAGITSRLDWQTLAARRWSSRSCSSRSRAGSGASA